MKSYELEAMKKIVNLGDFASRCISSIESAAAVIGAVAENEQAFNAAGGKIVVSVTCDQGESGQTNINFTAPAKWACVQAIIAAMDKCLAQAQSDLESIKPVEAVGLSIASAKVVYENAVAEEAIEAANAEIEAANEAIGG